MRALLTDPTSDTGLSMGETADPVAGPGRVLVAVHHISLNHGELRFLSRFPIGAVPGWDAAGVVVVGAEDGSGPPVGTRVVTYGANGGAWATLRAVDVRELAVVPDTVDLAEAAALPVAGVAALRALRAAGPLLGKRVLVTGASGGVGRFAVQLAALGGAEVIASVGSEARGEGLTELGARQVVTGLDGITEPVSVVLDNVGGATMVDSYALLAPGGSLQSIGWASGEAATFAPYSLGEGGKSITSFRIGNRLGADLGTLVGLVAKGQLRVDIGLRGPWEEAASAAKALLGRTVRGKVVLEVTRE